MDASKAQALVVLIYNLNISQLQLAFSFQGFQSSTYQKTHRIHLWYIYLQKYPKNVGKDYIHGSYGKRMYPLRFMRI